MKLRPRPRICGQVRCFRRTPTLTYCLSTPAAKNLRKDFAIAAEKDLTKMIVAAEKILDY